MCLPLSRSMRGHCVEVLSLVGRGWECITEKELATYLGVAVGPSLPLGCWVSIAEKILARVLTVAELGVGAPALPFLAKGPLWACAHHQLAVYTPDSVLDSAFRKAQAHLMKGPPGWLTWDIAICLGEFGWRFPPLSVRELGVRLQLSLLLRMSSHPFARRYGHIKQAVFNDDAPLMPFLWGWAMNGAYGCLNATLEQGVLHNFLAITPSGCVRVRSAIRDTKMNKKAFTSNVRQWMSLPGEPLALSNHAVMAWLRRRVIRVWGPQLDSYHSLSLSLVFVRSCLWSLDMCHCESTMPDCCN